MRFYSFHSHMLSSYLYKHLIAVNCPLPIMAIVQDLLELEQRTGDGRIHLQMSFKRGLHPFFSPAVQVSKVPCFAARQS